MRIMDTETVTQEKILKMVQTLPVANRLHLVQDILQGVTHSLELQPLPKNTLSRALGLLADDQPPPTDEEVEEWLLERRLAKYGS